MKLSGYKGTNFEAIYIFTRDGEHGFLCVVDPNFFYGVFPLAEDPKHKVIQFIGQPTIIVNNSDGVEPPMVINLDFESWKNKLLKEMPKRFKK